MCREITKKEGKSEKVNGELKSEKVKLKNLQIPDFSINQFSILHFFPGM